MQHPRRMGKTEIEAFLTHLAEARNVASSTQNQAFNAIMFLYKEVLAIGIGEDIQASRAKKPQRIPVVLTREECVRIMQERTPPVFSHAHPGIGILRQEG